MKRTPLNKIGKIGKRNLEANSKLKWIFNDYGIDTCELCGSDFCLSFAHKNKREDYRSEPELLYDFKQVLLLCINCHSRIDDRSKTTKKESDAIFNEKRK